ncbi:MULTISPECIES: molybdate ABC transporter substrate-binding protein [Chroococcidiopsis]|jgi:molybdate transport system substrate-binding protein|uniref:Molybdenum ABC transporter, periplasmic molybdate-binding protein n=1 Tax=Chroococcidiopsis thermalis (strain PCC 7203) TaxID=251229 RepID=K9U6S3_CHRTP|nr:MULTISPECIES: molybdate ABC transporter substrate-binding protein [Chroococcidiopsis]AFY89959.1 molybdenum ABC transporter, periplasmic molybdate-binding protein [Chroococcidiopsis thermalis PCC 7203]PSM47763.1 molybdate ABC transporter substrate-binding protein [Chroococcidiopsis sp. CCALA 051]
MKRKNVFAFICGVAIALILATIFNWLNPSPVVAQANTNLLISAAASLQDALKEAQPLFQKTQPKIEVNYNFGASGALQQQIEQGAPADIFFSAAAKQMNALQDKNLILLDTRRNLLTNRLVLVVSSNSDLKIDKFEQLTDTNIKRIAVGEFRSVPVGQYSEELFKKLGILSQVKPKLVFGNNVRNVLAAVESGNADAGIVYTTDAKLSNKVRVVATAAENLHSPIVYPIAIISSSKNLDAAKEYIQFLTDKQARTVFEKYGFGIAKAS